MTGGKKGKGKKPQRKSTKKAPPPVVEGEGGSVWDSLTNDLIMDIFSRLPVISLLRFRCVCKPLKSLIRSPRFVSLHLTRHNHPSRSTTPSLLVRSIHKPTLHNKLSLFSLSHSPPQPLPDAPPQPLQALPIASDAPPSLLPHAPPLPVFHAPPLMSPRAVVELSKFYPKTLLDMDVVGSCNGVVCVSQPPRAHFISIFNPATRRHRLLRHTIPVPADPELDGRVSVGLGFDPIAAHLKVISVLNFSVVSNTNTQVHVYNCNQDSWKIVQGHPYRFVKFKCDVIVSGVPYWMALCLLRDVNIIREVVAWFDVGDEVFHHLSVPAGATFPGNRTFAKIDDWKGEVGLLVCPLKEDGDTFVDVWLLEVDDETGFKDWSKKHVVGPIFKMNRMFGCVRNGQIVGLDAELRLTLYDPDSNRVERVDVDEDDIEKSFEVYNYSESLVSFKGESPVGKLPLQDQVEEATRRTQVDAKVRMKIDGDYEVVLPSNFPPGYGCVRYKELQELGFWEAVRGNNS